MNVPNIFPTGAMILLFGTCACRCTGSARTGDHSPQKTGRSSIPTCRPDPPQTAWSGIPVAWIANSTVGGTSRSLAANGKAMSGRDDSHQERCGRQFCRHRSRGVLSGQVFRSTVFPLEVKPDGLLVTLTNAAAGRLTHPGAANRSDDSDAGKTNREVVVTCSHGLHVSWLGILNATARSSMQGRGLARAPSGPTSTLPKLSALMS